MKLVIFTSYNADGTTNAPECSADIKGAKPGSFTANTPNPKGGTPIPVVQACTVITFNGGSTVNVKEDITTLASES